ncbi:M20 family peptidase [Pusillimonas caeni]|uniref:M20 family metallopeptidase n=1 Tax=Pusillimonas caeni TaxID=1348472 RepID=UPI000E59C49E|nr:M20/M25/M40 family metallo-hydrolase [Pusillimonas caeni]TFL11341.1 M20 family peptidase [Pusillimonas caeni]
MNETIVITDETLVETLQEFVRFPSQQTDLQEEDPHVKAFIKECAAPRLEEMGAAIRYDKMGNLIAEVGPKNGRSLMFVGYAMTHPASRMQDPFSATLVETPRGQAIRGRGVAEQKTALAAAFGAFEQAIKRDQLGGRLMLVLTTAGETGRHDAIESVMAELSEPPECAVILVGTNSKIAIGNKGRIDFEVIVGGKTSHSSAPWNGINAITGAQRLISELESLDLGVPDHPAFGPATLTPTAIDSSPKATHTVPDTVNIVFDRRLLPGEEPLQALASIKNAITLPEPWSVQFELGPIMYPNELPLESDFFHKLTKAFKLGTGSAPQTFHCNFALDAGYFCRRGIPAVMLGPGEVDQFHSNEEHVLVSDLVDMSKIYYSLIEQCLPAEAT